MVSNFNNFQQVYIHGPKSFIANIIKLSANVQPVQKSYQLYPLTRLDLLFPFVCVCVYFSTNQPEPSTKMQSPHPEL